jgi:hypothetical protein
MLGYSSQHTRAGFFAIMKGKYEIWGAWPL